jgi:hypothetical protein
MFSKTTTIRIDAYDSVKSLKMKIQVMEGIAPDLQRLMFNGKQLEDGKNLQAVLWNRNYFLRFRFRLSKKLWFRFRFLL